MMSAFFVGSVATIYAIDYLDKNFIDTYKLSVNKKISSVESGDKFVLGQTVLGNNTFYVFKDAAHGNYEYIDKDTVDLAQDNQSEPRYMDCGTYNDKCVFGERRLRRQLILPDGYVTKLMKNDISLSPF
jgi:hypothetical protein